MESKDKVKALKYICYLAIAVALLIGAYLVYKGVTTTEISIGSDKTIAVTPEKVVAIKEIGQWEFLTVVDEQVVDTIRTRHIVSDDRLTCIYYGNLRLGIDLDKAPDDWVINNNDTIIVTLPKPALLDEAFIDEARTQVFYENGRWSSYARDRMYRTAAARMKQYALTPANIESVRKSAVHRFESLFRQLGAKEVTVRFADSSELGS